MLQTVATVVILEVGKQLKYLDYNDWLAGGKQFVGVSIAFVTPMVFSMLAFKYVSVQTIVVFMTTALTLPAFLPGWRASRVRLVWDGHPRRPDLRNVRERLLLRGLLLVLRLAVEAVNCLYIKKIFNQLPQSQTSEDVLPEPEPFRSCSRWRCRRRPRGLPGTPYHHQLWGWCIILFSQAAGFGIVISGISPGTPCPPTAFNISNCSKPMTVLSFFIFGAETSAAALIGLGLLAAGILTRMRPEK